ncbi:hypothetical protein [Streptomyces albireticuli]|uniref:PLAT domain-containing protein n=1 Tax=Streptomyces albireticuli TaxID=1940 RepID=A0A2A2D388_9ACTN|nr:hypothetical protein [Streptomyces albireticuli]MCD9146028.1 hypothetical protein [Streptomyces albireticuli]MCD9165785.1 hypothetical protein [Streptomyces albireticuli]MCD9196003.1 hypothetical protein [Streptomyces albireticuli]PAU46903.1 hypothetical protein CK936_21630 [Streptomyces albireticuli]
MAAITQILAHLKTADTKNASTDSSVYLGIGGREFLLDLKDRDEMEQGADEKYYFGEGSNVEQKEYNDPSKPPLTDDDVRYFPVYLRLEPSGSDPGWCVEWASVTVNPDTPDAHRYIHPSLHKVSDTNRIWLESDAGKTLYLRPDTEGSTEN